MQGEYITDDAWIKMLIFFETHPKIYKCFELRLRRFVSGVYWIMKTGAQWRLLPSEFGKWNSVFRRFRRWVNLGIWKDLMTFCIEDPDLEYVMIDSTIVRAHACAAGRGFQPAQGLGRSKGGFTSKIHAKVDALGNPLQFIVTPGQESDHTQARHLLGSTTNSYVLCDKGYDSDSFRYKVIKQHNIPVIPGRKNRKMTIDYDKHIYKERSSIECFFSKIKHFRRVFSRYDKDVCSFVSFLYFVGAIIWLR
ncbi:IS5 family transposase [Candidatus Dependentiae bacterium]|nr:IS5 family transposase [Candidatus Dependentiae bacterium]